MMNGVLKLVIALVFAAQVSSIDAQYYYYNSNYYDNDLLIEIGGGIGGMNCITDLGLPEGNKKLYFNEIKWKFTNLSSSYYIALMYQQTIGLRLEATLGEIEAVDSILDKTSSRYRRNLSFRSTIRDIELLAEFHPLILLDYDEPPYFSPYVVGGIGRYTFNPQGNLNGQWIDLQPLKTEGQGFTEYADRKEYKLSQTNFAIGAGVKYELSSLFNVRLEWLQRFLFTDYLEDVSTRYIDPKLFAKYLSPAKAAQAVILNKRGARPTIIRGNPKNNDTYFTIQLKLGICLGRQRIR